MKLEGIQNKGKGGIEPIICGPAIMTVRAEAAVEGWIACVSNCWYMGLDQRRIGGIL